VLLVASAAWSARSFPRWLAGLLALTGACDLMGDLIGSVGGPLPFALFILPLVLLIATCSASLRRAGGTGLCSRLRWEQVPPLSGTRLMTMGQPLS
jgi:hypothetical protein